MKSDLHSFTTSFANTTNILKAMIGRKTQDKSQIHRKKLYYVKQNQNELGKFRKIFQPGPVQILFDFFMHCSQMVII